MYAATGCVDDACSPFFFLAHTQNSDGVHAAIDGRRKKKEFKKAITSSLLCPLLSIIHLHPRRARMASPTFTHLPILPLSAALSPDTKPRFLADLRSALLHVGFLYLSDTGLPDDLVQRVIHECRGFFEKLPLEEKEKIEMKNEKSFLGWSRVSCSLLSLVSIITFVHSFFSVLHFESCHRCHTHASCKAPSPRPIKVHVAPEYD